MMRDRRFLLPLVCILALVAVPSACKKKPIEEPPVEAPTEAPPPPPPRQPTPPPTEVEDRGPQPPPTDRLTVQEIINRGLLKTIYFGFDSSELSPEAQSALKANAQWLKSNQGYKIVIQGHCDERGTIEYNLALGERRANAVRDYMANLGIQRSDIRVVTYGEERPAVQGKDESAWSKNRRAETIPEE